LNDQLSSKSRAVVAGISALVCGLLGLYVLRLAISQTWFTIDAAGSAGLGAVSIGISEFVVNALLLGISNLMPYRLLAGWGL
jgi:hypothetical protein